MAAARGEPGRRGRPPREPASPSALAPALLRHVAAQDASGEGLAALAARGGLEASDAARESVAIGPVALATMLEVAGQLLGDPHLSLRLPTALVSDGRYDAGALAARVASTP